MINIDDDDDSYNRLYKHYKIQRNKFLTSCLIYTVCEVLSLLTYTLTQSLNHLLTHLLTFSLTYLLTHSLTHLLTLC